MEIWYMKKGDRTPALQATIVDAIGNPVNLVGATVTFNMNDSTNTPKISDAACVVVDAINGVVNYAWGATDTNTAGTFYGEFAVVGGGLEGTFPNDHNFQIIIMGDLG